MVEDIKVDKNKGKKQDANKPKTNEKQVLIPANRS